MGGDGAGQLLVLALCLQHVLGYTPLQAGFAMVPQGLAGFSAGLLGAGHDGADDRGDGRGLQPLAAPRGVPGGPAVAGGLAAIAFVSAAFVRTRRADEPGLALPAEPPNLHDVQQEHRLDRLGCHRTLFATCSGFT
jgi:hypothetical protein